MTKQQRYNIYKILDIKLNENGVTFQKGNDISSIFSSSNDWLCKFPAQQMHPARTNLHQSDLVRVPATEDISGQRERYRIRHIVSGIGMLRQDADLL